MKLRRLTWVDAELNGVLFTDVLEGLDGYGI
jgi:hypothetical protein